MKYTEEQLSQIKQISKRIEMDEDDISEIYESILWVINYNINSFEEYYEIDKLLRTGLTIEEAIIESKKIISEEQKQELRKSIKKISEIIAIDERVIKDYYEQYLWVLKYNIKDYEHYNGVSTLVKLGMDREEVISKYFNYYEYMYTYNLTLTKLKQCDLYSYIHTEPLATVCMEHQKYLNNYTAVSDNKTQYKKYIYN